MSPTSIFTPLREDLGDLGQAVLVDVFLEHGGDRLGHDGVEHLPLGHLVAAHQVELELAERRRVEVAQVADPRHGRLLAEHGRALPGARRPSCGSWRCDSRALTPDCWSTYFDSPGGTADLLDELLHEVGNDDGEVKSEVGGQSTSDLHPRPLTSDLRLPAP